MAFKKPDLNAPRFRQKCATILTNDLLQDFKNKFPQYSDLNLKQFKEIIMTFNGQLVEGVKDNRDGVELPEGLGFVFMATCPRASTKNGKKNIDFKRSNELGMPVTYQNWESNNKLLKIFYTNFKTKFRLGNREIWAFRLAKHHRSYLAKAYRSNWNWYRVVENTKRISALFESITRRKWKSPIDANYDEFKMNQG